MKKVRWVRSSRDDLIAFPRDAQGELGYGIYLAQLGEKHKDAKPLQGDLSGVMEMASDSRTGNTYRAVYIVKFNPFVYVPHGFEKKSRKGIATPKAHLDMIRQRLKEAKAEHEEYLRGKDAKTQQRKRT